MRTIKFRAWDKKENKWLLGYELSNLGGFSMFGECMMFGEWSQILNSRPLQELDTIELMQYTGLLDKNGKEIYEGDLVSIEHHWAGDWEKRPHEVKYSDGAFYPWGTGDWEEGSSNWEIIGNIWENGDLLTKEQI